MNLTIVYVAIALVIVILAQDFMHYKERQDLYDRIMAKDLSEYKTPSGAPPKGRNGIKKNLEKEIARRG